METISKKMLCLIETISARTNIVFQIQTASAKKLCLIKTISDRKYSERKLLYL